MTTSSSPRVYADQDRMLPKVLIRALIALVFASLAIATFASFTDRPLMSTPPVSPVVAETSVVLISDGVSGAVSVTNIDGEAIVDLTAQEGGFIAGVHRVIIRERSKHRVALDGPVTISAFENGRIGITDPTTGWTADLMGFGAGNAAAFAKLLASAQTKGGRTDGTAN